MKKIKYLKPGGNELDVNDTEANREYAAINGWKEIKPKPKAKPKTKDRPTQLDKLI